MSKMHTLEEIKMHFMVLESMRLELESIKWWHFREAKKNMVLEAFQK